MPGKLVHFELPARDATRARDFWSGLFGWSFNDPGMPGGDPFRKVREFGKMHNWRDAAQVKANVRSNGFDLFGGAHSRMLLFHGIYSE